MNKSEWAREMKKSSGTTWNGDDARHDREKFRLRRTFWPKLKRSLALLPFAEDLVAAYYCAFDRDTPRHVQVALIGALAYFVLPFDLVPDIILGLGFTDDLAVLLAAFNVVRTHVTEAHRARARETLERLRRGERVSA